MAGVALHRCDVHSYIHRMLEGLSLELHFGEIGRFPLREERVAGAAVVRDHFTVRALVQPIVAAEAAV